MKKQLEIEWKHFCSNHIFLQNLPVDSSMTKTTSIITITKFIEFYRKVLAKIRLLIRNQSLIFILSQVRGVRPLVLFFVCMERSGVLQFQQEIWPGRKKVHKMEKITRYISLLVRNLQSSFGPTMKEFVVKKWRKLLNHWLRDSFQTKR